ncbi:MAG: hypothetical protein AB7O62_09610 [Pirellulales bacterium]
MLPDDTTPAEMPCPACGRKLRYRDEHRGKRVLCPGCRGAVAIPDLESLASLGPALAEAWERLPPPQAFEDNATIAGHLVAVGGTWL